MFVDDITFLRGLKVTVLYFSVIDVIWLRNLCEADGDAGFVPQANPVYSSIYLYIQIKSSFHPLIYSFLSFVGVG